MDSEKAESFSTFAVQMPSLPVHTNSSSGRFSWLRLLIAITLLAITTFQLYWLRENYLREQKSLTLKTDALFRETMMRIQADKLNLDSLRWQQNIHGEVKVVALARSNEAATKALPPQEMITTINLLRNKIEDSASGKKKDVVIKLKQTRAEFQFDSVNVVHKAPRGVQGNQIFEILYGVDSLQQPIRIGEIDTAYKTALQKTGISIPFQIIKKDSCNPGVEEQPNEVTVGFAKPVVYRMNAGNTFPYLFRRISPAILFSLALLGITIFSFIMLYRNMQRQRRLAESKNEFISNITHELKTPIATVGVAIEALKNFNAIQDPQRTREYLDISSNELQRLNLLVDKVLKLSMFEKQDVELRSEILNLGELVREVEGSLKLQTEKYHATITVHTEGDLNLQGDRLHLQSVVFNLLDNALKYGNEQPVINVSLKGNEEAVVLKVSDNGIGIAPEYKDKVFEKFFRVPHGDTHNAKGYGLGLSYVAQVVKKHKGTIDAESEPGRGTIFTITLPKQPA